MKLRRAEIISILCIVLSFPWSVRAGIAVLGGLTHERSVLPGEMYRGTVVIRNDGEEQEEVKIYQSDYLFFCDGSNAYGEPGEVPRSNAEWIEFRPSRVTVPPHEDVEVHYSLQVPYDLGLIGTYWSMLMVEPVPDPLKAREQQEGVSIKVLVRYAIQIITHIGATGDRRLKFLDTRLVKGEGGRTLQVDVENTGERLLRPFVWVEIYNEEGSSIGTFEGERFRTYPGTSLRYQIDIGELPEGTYKALVVADCEGDDLFGINYTMKIEE